ncbi:MAG: VanZ family protein [Gemmatimonadaceae bacterium]
MTLIITLLPFQFAWPSTWRVMLTGDGIDIGANVLMFIPLGFLYRLGTRHHQRHSALRVLWVGALLSAAIESAQLFEVERFTSPLDVATNALGAFVGAVASDRTAERLRAGEGVVGRLSLELPLMGLVYLILPLLWLNGLASGDSTGHAGLSLLVAVFGASILGGLQRCHFGPDRAVKARQTALATVAWYVGGAFPLLPNAPGVVAGGGILAGLLAWWRGSGSVGPDATGVERRYEVTVLRSALPAYVAYLVLLGVSPLMAGIGPWSAGLGFPGTAMDWTKLEILRHLELVAAFTLLGYVLAESRGRSHPEFSTAFRRICLWSLGAAASIELFRGFHVGHGASVTRLTMLVGASLYGGWLYYLQRAHVQQLLGRR